MKNFFYKVWSKASGKNLKSTPVSVISEQLNEPRALPLGMEEFEVWSDRIISAAPILNAEIESQKFALATMVMQLGPQESHKPDMYFVKTLLKSAANQVAHAKMGEIRDAAKSKLALQEAAKAEALKQAEANVVPTAEETLKRVQEMKLKLVPTSEATQSDKDNVADVKPA